MATESTEALLKAVRDAADERVWSAAVKLAREGAVVGDADEGDEIRLKVKTRGRAVPHEVYLWPADRDWGCDCGLPGDVCVHVAAAVIAMHQVPAGAVPSTNATPTGNAGPRPLPQAKKQFQVKLMYGFTAQGNVLNVHRSLKRADGSIEPLRGTLAENDVIATRADAQVEALLTRQTPEAPLNPETLRRLLVLLDGTHADATLDDQPIQLSGENLPFRVRLSDEGEGFKIALVRPAGIEALFRGAALLGGQLRPTSHGDLTPEQKKLLARGTTFEVHEVGRLVADVLPRLRERIEVQIDTKRLPGTEELKPRVLLVLAEREAGLEVRADLVYGDPPVAKVENGMLKATGAVVPARDLAAERTVVMRFEQQVGLPVGYRHVLPPEKAAAFLRDRLPKHDGPVHGEVSEKRFKVVEAGIVPQIEVRAASDGSSRGSWELDVKFAGPIGTAEPRAVLSAWASGRTLVPLLEGGYAPLPTAWLEVHGGLLRELLEARDAKGRVDRHATAALVELLEDTDCEVPPDLRRLRSFLEGGGDVPEVPIPPGFVGELRPYQEGGFRWLRFLRDVDLNGVLADDMGLGKTIQAIAAMLDAGGQHLVVAPTSVLKNWEREIARFGPGLRVNVYHGPGRKLDASEVTLTSYALLRMDLTELSTRVWTYAILDEAQSIKNPDSQTARSARQLKAHHRLCLTGTPVENRLEELWSLFRYLMPGFLGSIEAFRDRFSRPIEAGDPKARDALRKRVRPYILRRLKQQVATELPPLTDVVVRCEMGSEQRRVYEAVRMSAREDVQRAIAERGVQGATMQVLEALLRMRQACCDPELLPGEVGVGAGSCKLERLEELLVEMVCDEHKALIFSQWTSLLDLVERRLIALGIPWVRLDGSTRDRQAVIDTFQSPAGPPVFLLSLKAGGTGLNLTAADYVVHLDPWWNPAVQQQATDRAHRIGQDKPVVSCRLIAEDTVEERILELQDAKRALADAALGTEGGFLRTLSSEELRSLFEAA
jgi:superfamily II DNA or RNA helicase